MKDKWGRTIDYLRLSLTDRCNLRCRYCMPEALTSVGHEAVLRYEEMQLICRAALALGIDRFKITGGEPLVRKGAVAFMESLKAMKGVRSVTVTTNGLLLSDALPDLVRMGINGINTIVWNPAIYPDKYIWYGGSHHNRCSDRISYGCISCKGCKQKNEGSC